MSYFCLQCKQLVGAGADCVLVEGGRYHTACFLAKLADIERTKRVEPSSARSAVLHDDARAANLWSVMRSLLRDAQTATAIADGVSYLDNAASIAVERAREMLTFRPTPASVEVLASALGDVFALWNELGESATTEGTNQRLQNTFGLTWRDWHSAMDRLYDASVVLAHFGELEEPTQPPAEPMPGNTRMWMDVPNLDGESSVAKEKRMARGLVAAARALSEPAPASVEAMSRPELIDAIRAGRVGRPIVTPHVSAWARRWLVPGEDSHNPSTLIGAAYADIVLNRKAEVEDQRAAVEAATKPLLARIAELEGKTPAASVGTPNLDELTEEEIVRLTDSWLKTTDPDHNRIGFTGFARLGQEVARAQRKKTAAARFKDIPLTARQAAERLHAANERAIAGQEPEHDFEVTLRCNPGILEMGNEVLAIVAADRAAREGRIENALRYLDERSCLAHGPHSDCSVDHPNDGSEWCYVCTARDFLGGEMRVANPNNIARGRKAEGR